MTIPKFKVYHRKDKKIYDVYQITRFTNGNYQVGITGTSWQIYISGESKEGDLIMCSGLFDMKNKEIYEEDIIRKEMCSSDDPAYGFYGDEGIVKFKNGAFIVVWSGGIEELLCKQIQQNIEIVGNTYEKEVSNIL